MYVWLLKLKCMLYVNVKRFPYYENKQFLIDMGKIAIEYFIDLLTSADSEVLRAVASSIYTGNITLHSSYDS